MVRLVREEDGSAEQTAGRRRETYNRRERDKCAETAVPTNGDRSVSVVRAAVVCEYVRTSDVRGRRRSSRGRGPRVLPLPVQIRRFFVVVVVVIIAVAVSCRDSAVQL